MNEENGNEAEKKSILGIFVCIRFTIYNAMENFQGGIYYRNLM